MTIDRVNEALKRWIDPNTGRDLVSDQAAKVQVTDHQVTVNVTLKYPARSQWETLRTALRQHLNDQLGADDVVVNVSSVIETHEVSRGLKPLPGIANIIAVASGKGGVGKSTTAINLALALAAEGARVGVLDADVYGPSLPILLGTSERPVSTDNKSMEPIEAWGLQASSVGFLISEDTPMVWRGPMATQALTQLLNDTRWRTLDYLIVDMPPGTGDIQLTLAQKVPVTGAVIVTTPQDLALADARKGLKMFEKVSVPILGIVENMAIHVCSQCGHAEHLFGQGGGEKMAADYGVPHLGSLPLDIRIREQADSGKPTVVADPEGALAAQYKAIALKLAVAVAGLKKDLSHKFPNIVVQNH